MPKFPIFKNPIFQLCCIFLTTSLIVIILNKFNLTTWLSPLNNFIVEQEINFIHWLKLHSHNYFTLPILAFCGGLIASISPCKLALLTVNLSYIGTRKINSRGDAVKKIIAFVIGVIFVLSLLGLISGLTSAIFFKYRGYIHLMVALIMISMGLSLLELIYFPPLPSFPIIHQIQKTIPHQLIHSKIINQQTAQFLNPFGVGVSFALVGSPCSSPVLLSVLGAAATTGNPFQSVLTMIFYALGDTFMIFLASLFTSLAVQTRKIRQYSAKIIKIGGFFLIIAGSYYLITGIRWLALIFHHV